MVAPAAGHCLLVSAHWNLYSCKEGVFPITAFLNFCIPKPSVGDNPFAMGLKERMVTLTRSRSAVDENTAETTGAQARHELENFRKQHKWDPFLDNEKLDTIESALHSDNAEKAMAVDETLIQEDSPYPEVRASVRSFTPVYLKSFFQSLTKALALGSPY